MTIASSNNNNPYCASAFYVYVKEKNLLVFMSDKTTRHISDTEKNKNVAGTILPKKVKLAQVIGIQFTGEIHELQDDLRKLCLSKYLKAFPVAALHSSTLWGIEPPFIKMTDSRLGFGKKIIWNKSVAPGI